MPRGAEDTTGSNEADFGTFHQYIDESFDFLDTNWHDWSQIDLGQSIYHFSSPPPSLSLPPLPGLQSTYRRPDARAPGSPGYLNRTPQQPTTDRLALPNSSTPNHHSHLSLPASLLPFDNNRHRYAPPGAVYSNFGNIPPHFFPSPPPARRPSPSPAEREQLQRRTSNLERPRNLVAAAIATASGQQNMAGQARKHALVDHAAAGSPSSKRFRRSSSASRHAPIEEIDLASDQGSSQTMVEKEREKECQDLVNKQQSRNESDSPKRFGEMSCIICLDNFTNLSATPCGHIFCHECLTQALLVGQKTADRTGHCPMCRKALKSSSKGHIIPLALMRRKKYEEQNYDEGGRDRQQGHGRYEHGLAHGPHSSKGPRGVANVTKPTH